MSFSERLDKIVDAPFDLGAQAADFVIDAATHTAKNINPIDALIESWKDNIMGMESETGTGEKSVASALLGPEGVIGAPIGALPGFVRDPFSRLIWTPFMEIMQYSYKNFIDRPIGVLATVERTISSEIGGEDTNIFERTTNLVEQLLPTNESKLYNAQTYKQAWDVTNSRSAGQALALSIFHIDILDPKALQEAKGSNWYFVTSGVFDFAMNIGLDPAYLVARGARWGYAMRRAKETYKATGVYDANMLQTSLAPFEFRPTKPTRKGQQRLRDEEFWKNWSYRPTFLDETIAPTIDETINSQGFDVFREQIWNIAEEVRAGRRGEGQIDLAHPVTYLDMPGRADTLANKQIVPDDFGTPLNVEKHGVVGERGGVVYHGSASRDLHSWIDPQTGELVVKANPPNPNSLIPSVSFSFNPTVSLGYANDPKMWRGEHATSGQGHGIVFEIDIRALDPYIDARTAKMPHTNIAEIRVNFDPKTGAVVPFDEADAFRGWDPAEMGLIDEPILAGGEVRIPKDKFRVIDAGADPNVRPLRPEGVWQGDIWWDIDEAIEKGLYVEPEWVPPKPLTGFEDEFGKAFIDAGKQGRLGKGWDRPADDMYTWGQTIAKVIGDGPITNESWLPFDNLFKLALAGPGGFPAIERQASLISAIMFQVDNLGGGRALFDEMKRLGNEIVELERRSKNSNDLQEVSNLDAQAQALGVQQQALLNKNPELMDNVMSVVSDALAEGETGIRGLAGSIDSPGFAPPKPGTTEFNDMWTDLQQLSNMPWNATLSLKNLLVETLIKETPNGFSVPTVLDKYATEIGGGVVKAAADEILSVHEIPPLPDMQLPYLGPMNRLGYKSKTFFEKSGTYRNIMGTNAVRMVVDKVAQNIIDLQQPSAAYIQVERMLRDVERIAVGEGNLLATAGLNADDVLIGFLNKSNDKAALQQHFDDVVEAINEAVVETFGSVVDDATGKAVKLSGNDLRKILDGQIFDSKELLNKAADDQIARGYGNVDYTEVVWEQSKGETIVRRIPISPGQMRKAQLVPRYDLLDRYIKMVQGDLKTVPTSTGPQKVSIAAERHKVMAARRMISTTWKRGVLLTPRWQMVVNLDSMLRNFAHLGVMESLAGFGNRMDTLRARWLQRAGADVQGVVLTKVDETLNKVLTDKHRASMAKGQEARERALLEEEGYTAFEAAEAESIRLALIKRDLDDGQMSFVDRVRTYNELYDEGLIELNYNDLYESVVKEEYAKGRQQRRTLYMSGLGLFFAGPVGAGIAGALYGVHARKSQTLLARRRVAEGYGQALLFDAKHMVDEIEQAERAMLAGLDDRSILDLDLMTPEEVAKLGEDSTLAEILGQAKRDRREAAKLLEARSEGVTDYQRMVVENFRKDQPELAGKFDEAAELLSDIGYGQSTLGSNAIPNPWGDTPQLRGVTERLNSANPTRRAIWGDTNAQARRSERWDETHQYNIENDYEAISFVRAWDDFMARHATSPGPAGQVPARDFWRQQWLGRSDDEVFEWLSTEGREVLNQLPEEFRSPAGRMELIRRTRYEANSLIPQIPEFAAVRKQLAEGQDVTWARDIQPVVDRMAVESNEMLAAAIRSGDMADIPAATTAGQVTALAVLEKVDDAAYLNGSRAVSEAAKRVQEMSMIGRIRNFAAQIGADELRATNNPAFTPPPANWHRYKHFTSTQGKAALEGGQPFDPTLPPMHGMGGKGLGDVGTGAEKLAGDRLYLSLDDSHWESTLKATDTPDKFVPIDDAPLGAPEVYDYTNQRWMAQTEGIEHIYLESAEYAINPSHRKLVIDSPEAYRAALDEAREIGGELAAADGKNVYLVGESGAVTDGWMYLEQRYDIVEIRNVKQHRYGAQGGKFFNTAGSDQIIVLNRDVVRVVPQGPAAGAATPQAFIERATPMIDFGKTVTDSSFMDGLKTGTQIERTKEIIRTVTDNWFENMTMVEDTLSRGTMFEAAYERAMAIEMQRLRLPNGKYRVSGDAVEQMSQRARRYALAETKKILYELADRTRFEEIATELFPFLGAWQEVASRWIGLAGENPVFVSRALRGWGLITGEDENGQSRIVIQVPKFMDATIGQMKLFGKLSHLANEDIDLNLKSASMIGALPGFGPLVSFSVSELIVKNPDIDESLGWMLPYGFVEGQDVYRRFLNSHTPSWVRNGAKAVGMTDEGRAKTAARVTQDMITQYTEQGIDLPNTPEAIADFEAEVYRRTQAIYGIRMLRSIAVPVSFRQQSPYWGIISEYWRVQEEHSPEIADAWLLENHPDLWAFTARTTMSDQVRAGTLEGHANYKKHQEFIDAHPVLAGFVKGEIGATDIQFKYNRAVAELEEREGRRDYMNPTGILVEAAEAMGWREWRVFRNSMDNELRLRAQGGGSSSLLAKSNFDLWKQRRTFVEDLGGRNVHFMEDFNTFGQPDTQRKVLEAFRALLVDPTFAYRPEIPQIAMFVSKHDDIAYKMLRRAQSSNNRSYLRLSYSGNEDLRQEWDVWVLQIKTWSDFGSIYDRYFSNMDTISVNNLPSTGIIEAEAA